MYKLFLIFFIAVAGNSYAKGIYQEPEAFIAEAFSQPPKPRVIWIKGELRKQIEEILQHKNKARRIRYWQQENRSVWILKEVGKKKPITVGIIIDDDKIAQLKVLVFLESRGWEVRYPFFTQQFNQLSLKQNNALSKSIDGISGATLSVRALEKLSRIALLLNKQLQQQDTLK